MLNSTLYSMLQGVIASFLKDRCDIEIEQETGRGTTGESLRAFVSVASDVPCRMFKAASQNTDRRALISEQESIDEVYRFALPAAVEISLDMRILYGGARYYVQAIERRMSDQLTNIAVCSRKEGIENV